MDISVDKAGDLKLGARKCRLYKKDEIVKVAKQYGVPNAAKKTVKQLCGSVKEEAMKGLNGSGKAKLVSRVETGTMSPRRVVKKGLPLSGTEPVFTERKWSTPKGIRNNNCYAYAVGDYQAHRWQKSVPGDRSGLSNGNHNYTHCTDLPRRVVSDNPKAVYKARAEEKCKKGYYKVMMFVSPGRPTNYIRQGDFHFYRQHGVVEYKIKPGDTVVSVAKFFKVPETQVRRAGPFKVGKRIIFKANVFSHKRGWATGPLLEDANGKAILDPRTASRAYPQVNYEKYCSSFCVKDSGIKVGGKTRPKVRKNAVKRPDSRVRNLVFSSPRTSR
jgi:hypothetical protein